MILAIPNHLYSLPEDTLSAAENRDAAALARTRVFKQPHFGHTESYELTQPGSKQQGNSQFPAAPRDGG
jgi:hypothetical protein